MIARILFTVSLIAAPISAILAAITDNAILKVLVVVAVVTLLATDSLLKRATSAQRKAYLQSLNDNAECLFLEDCYIIAVPPRTDGTMFAAVRAGNRKVIAYGRSFDETLTRAITSLANA